MVYKKRDVVRWLKKLWRERRPLAVAAIVLVIGLPIVITLAHFHRPGKISPAVDGAIQQASAATNSGDYSAAYKDLKAAEGQAKTKEQKVAFYSELAAAAANNGKPGEAIQYLKTKHRVDPSTAGPDGQMLGSLYEQTGDRADALAQYKLALDYYNSLESTPTNNATKQSLEAIITGLEGGQQ